MYFLQKKERNNPKVKMGTRRGMRLEYMKHMNSWRVMSACSAG